MNGSKETKTEVSNMLTIGPVWCDRCNIRIAPYEGSVVRAAKSYHQRCLKKDDADNSN